MNSNDEGESVLNENINEENENVLFFIIFRSVTMIFRNQKKEI